MCIYKTTLIPRRALWGGMALQKAFDLSDEFGNGVGQAWAFSAQEGASSILISGEYTGWTLLDLWRERPDIFKSNEKDFPFIISLVAPEDNLSIQVHPGDDAAGKLGLSHGKNEAWYFLSAESDASIVYGHNARDEADLQRYVANGQWNELVRRMPVKTGDTVYIPAGTLHALCGGCVVYEIQQSTDITYRFYDYGRQDEQGKTRPLQLKDAIECLKYDDAEAEAHPAAQTHHFSGFTETVLIQNNSFTVRRLDLEGQCTLHYSGYLLCTVIEGAGSAGEENLKKGDSFLLPAGEKFRICGRMTLLTTAEK